MTSPHFCFHGCQVKRTHFRYGGCHVTPTRVASDSPRHTRDPPRPTQVVPIRIIKPRTRSARCDPRWYQLGHFQFSGFTLPAPLLVRRKSVDPHPLPVPQVSGDPATLPCCGCHLTAPRGQMTLPHHTREMPRPTQVIPIRVIKPLGKMAPAGIQDGTGRTTSGSAAVA